MINVNQTSQVLVFIENASRVICMAHSNPDGDAIGSLLGWTHIIRNRFPEKEILSICRDSAPPSFSYMKDAETIRSDYTPLGGDVVFILDSAESKLTDYHTELPVLFDSEQAQAKGITTIKLDHHPVGSDFAQLNIVDSDSASTAEIVVDIADAIALPITADAATCLLTGIYTDTGSMMHSNTSARVYRTAARLLKAGANQKSIIQDVYRTSKLSTLKLWGRVLENISLTEEGGAISALKKSDFLATGAHFSELTGVIDYVNAIPGMRFSMILSERDGKVKGSLRTLSDDVDVAAMAQKFQGGGHKKAAGFSIEGELEKEVRWKVKPT